jgi:hypothetical protein
MLLQTALKARLQLRYGNDTRFCQNEHVHFVRDVVGCRSQSEHSFGMGHSVGRRDGARSPRAGTSDTILL